MARPSLPVSDPGPAHLPPLRPAFRRVAALLLTGCLATQPMMLAAQQPLSASDWLSGSVRGPQRESYKT